jgi:thiamine biosynthesis lipoprotein
VIDLNERHFRGMNTQISAWMWSDGPLASVWLNEAEAFFREIEAELSRFRPDSGLSRLNAAAGDGPQAVSGTLRTVLGLALAAARGSGGIFDPTVLNPLRSAGYDLSFETLAAGIGAAAGGCPGNSAGASLGWQQVMLDTAHSTVELPAGVGIDLGGIAKGWTVDRAAEMLGAWSAALVDAGGDIRASAAPGGEPWPIAIEDPFDNTRDLGVIRLAEGAVATSSVGRRRWQRDGQTMHHLIDPRTGAPSRSDLHTVAVVAPTAMEAELAAKIVLILGSREGQAYLETRELSGLLIGHDGGQQAVGKLTLEPFVEA